MARTMSLAGLAAASLLSLAACQVLFIGVFPASAAQVSARADLSSYLTSSEASTFQFCSASIYGKELYVLFSSTTFDSSKVHLFLIDSNLAVIGTATLDTLNAVPPATVFQGQSTMTDYNGDFVIGNIKFAPDFSSATKFSTGPVLNSPSVTVAPAIYNETNFRVVGSSLQWDEYDETWAPQAPFTMSWPIGTPSPSPQSSLELLDVFSDPFSSVFPCVFVFYDGSAETAYFTAIPKADINLGTSPPVPDVFSVYGTLAAKSNVERDSIGFSYKGVVAYDHTQRALIHFDLGSPNDVKNMSINWSGGMKLAAGLYSGETVVWDPHTRMLARYEPWW